MSMKDVLKTEAGVKLAVLALAAAFVAGMAFATALAEKRARDLAAAYAAGYRPDAAAPVPAVPDAIR